MVKLSMSIAAAALSAGVLAGTAFAGVDVSKVATLTADRGGAAVSLTVSCSSPDERGWLFLLLTQDRTGGDVYGELPVTCDGQERTYSHAFGSWGPSLQPFGPGAGLVSFFLLPNCLFEPTCSGSSSGSEKVALVPSHPNR